MAWLILSLSAPIRRQVLGRRWRHTSGRPVTVQTPMEKARTATLQWFDVTNLDQCDERPEKTILRNWKTRWRHQASKEGQPV
jgi:hypothetical protein